MAAIAPRTRRPSSNRAVQQHRRCDTGISQVRRLFLAGQAPALCWTDRALTCHARRLVGNARRAAELDAGGRVRPEPPPSRAELRYPPGAYYRRIALGTVLPGAGLLGTRWKVLGWLLVARVAGRSAPGSLVKAWQGGLLRSALNVAVQPELLQWVGCRHHGRRGAVGRLDRAHRRAVLAAPSSRRSLGPGALRRRRVHPDRRTVGPGRALHRRAVVGHRRGVRRGQPRRAPRRRARRHRRRGPVGRRAAGQHPAHRVRRRQGPLGHPHRLDDGGQHQHQDRRHPAHRHPAQPRARARSRGATRCTRSTPTGTTAATSA